jgi:hypothetical protein
MRFVSILQAAALFLPAIASAQTEASVSWPVTPGARVRILSPLLGERKEIGTVVTTGPDTLFFRQSAQGETRALTTAMITAIDVASGKRTRKMKGAIVGFLAGTVLGGILGSAVGKEAENCDYCFNPSTRAEFTLIFAGLGGALGAGVGTLVGMRQAEIWVPVAIPPATRFPRDED